MELRADTRKRGCGWVRFKSGHVRVTTVERVHVKMTFAAFSFNLHQLLTLKKQGMVQR